MLLRRSGENQSEDYNLGVITEADEGRVGIDREDILLEIAGAVVNGDPQSLEQVRKTGAEFLGEQALADAIAVAAGFNGITKVANATGLPLDAETETTTVLMREQTRIDQFADSYKANQF